MDYGLPGFSVRGLLQARIVEWVVIPFSRGSSRPRAQTWVSCILYHLSHQGLALTLLVNSQILTISWASLVAQLVKNLPAMQETWVQSLGQEDPLEKGMTTHSSILAWRIPENPMDREAWRTTVHGLIKSQT